MINALYQGPSQVITSDAPKTLVGANHTYQTPQTPQTSEQSTDTKITLSDAAHKALAENDKDATAGTGIQSPVSIHDLPPLTFFNQADVDAYDEHLMETLASHGIDTSQPIDFGFAYDGTITVKNDHPDKDAIEAVFAEDMDLRNGLIQTSNFYMFQELFSLNEQWAEKLASGMSEQVAGQWLVNAAKSATAKNSQGLSYAGGASQDPFAGKTNQTHATQTYAS